MVAMNKITLASVAGFALALCALSATAAPVQWTVAAGGNDHWYEWVASPSSGNTWTQARSNALARTHMGMSGYLATVTSAGENNFLGTLSLDGWLGASDEGAEGVWKWMDGLEAGTTFWTGGPGGAASGYSNWNGGEPNNLGGEDYAHRNGGRWNDLPNFNYNIGYFVEYSGTPGAVSLPGTLSLGALAVALMAVSQRRRA
jgi:hypothetical protein